MVLASRAPSAQSTPARLSTVRRADLILLMEDGRVMERGTHQELMAARGIYHEMVVRQMESHGRDGESVLR